MAERELLDITTLQRTIRLGDLYTRKGKISKIMGLMVEATGLECNMGDICRIQLGEERYALAEVVGILEDTVQLMPYQELDGIGSGSVVINTGRKLEVGITPKMLGRAVDALGSPIDGRDPFPEEEKVWYPINGQPSNPMERPPITEVMELGVRAIDGLLTMGSRTEGSGTMTYTNRTVSVENGRGTTQEYITGQSGRTGDMGGIAVSSEGKAVSVVTLSEAEGVDQSAFDGLDAVVIDGVRVPISDTAEGYNSDTEQWVTLSQARAYSDTFTVYYSGTLGVDAVVRVIATE